MGKARGKHQNQGSVLVEKYGHPEEQVKRQRWNAAGVMPSTVPWAELPSQGETWEAAWQREKAFFHHISNFAPRVEQVPSLPSVLAVSTAAILGGC